MLSQSRVFRTKNTCIKNYMQQQKHYLWYFVKYKDDSNKNLCYRDKINKELKRTFNEWDIGLICTYTVVQQCFKSTIRFVIFYDPQNEVCTYSSLLTPINPYLGVVDKTPKNVKITPTIPQNVWKRVWKLLSCLKTNKTYVYIFI